jgi:hypothetical protein
VSSTEAGKEHTDFRSSECFSLLQRFKKFNRIIDLDNPYTPVIVS